MILVELAGAGGVGKSTLAPLIADRLRAELGADRVAALPEHGVPRRERRWTRLARWRWTAAHPTAFLAARHLTRSPLDTARYSSWMRIFSTMGIARRLLAGGVQVVLVDQGILRLPLLPAHAARLPVTALPDLVLQIVADPASIELRRIWRQKTKHRKLQGEARLAKARDTRRLLTALPADPLRAAMVQFGHQFCDPPFSDDEIATLLAPPPPAPPAGSRKPGRCEPDACAALRQRGLAWLEIDNSGSETLDQAADRCVRAILDALARAPGGHSGREV